MKVKDIMTTDVVYAEVPGSASEALELLVKNNISGIPVVKRGAKEVLGFVTRDDFARHPEETQLALLMSREVVKISADADVKEAVQLFIEKGIRRLPVISDGGLVGIVTIRDLMGAIGEMGIKTPVENYMRDKFTAVWDETPLKVVREIMQFAGVRAVPVLNSEAKLCGILADTDLLKIAQLAESTQKSELSAAMEGDKWGWDSKNVIYITKKTLVLPEKAVKEVMTRDVISATKKTSISECAKRMAKARIEQMPVISAEGGIIGLARDVDLLKVI